MIAMCAVDVIERDMGLILKCNRPSRDEAAVIVDFEVDDAEAWHDYGQEYAVSDMSRETVVAWLNDHLGGDSFDREVAKAERAESGRAASVGEDWA